MFGNDFPKDLPSFEKRFCSDETCRDYLFKLKWPDGFSCPKCGRQKFWWTSKHKLHCSGCGHQASVTVGTVMENTKKPLSLWFKAIFLVAFQKSGINAVNLKNLLGFGSYQTAWSWLQKIRRAMVRQDREKLGFQVEKVQADETYVGGKKPGKRGRGADGKYPMAVAVEINEPKGMGRLRMRVLNNCSTYELSSFLLNNVECGTTVITDDWSGYNLAHLAGFTREIVEDVNEGLKCVHLAVSLFKRWLLGIHQGSVGPKNLQYYADEFVFRFNRRKSKNRMKVVSRLFEQVVKTAAVTYNELVGRIRKKQT